MNDNNWISVSERLPKETEEDLRPKHLIYNADGIAVQEWRHYSFGWSFDDETGPPTHWMEEIDPPNKEKPCCDSPGKEKCDQCQEVGLASPLNQG